MNAPAYEPFNLSSRDVAILAELVQLRDWIIAAASGQTTTQLTRNGQPTGDYLLNAVYLASITTRPPLNVMFGPIHELGAYQLA